MRDLRVKMQVGVQASHRAMKGLRFSVFNAVGDLGLG